MPILKVRLRDIRAQKIIVRTYRGSREALDELKSAILSDRAAHKPPGTAIHTPVPAGVKPGGFVASFLVADPLEIEDDPAKS
jgi:hypothetical protein